MAKKTDSETKTRSNELSEVEFNHTTSPTPSKTKRATTKRPDLEQDEPNCPTTAVDGDKPTQAKTKRTGRKQGHELDHTTIHYPNHADQTGLEQDDAVRDEPNWADADKKFRELPQSARALITKQAARKDAAPGSRLAPRGARNTIEQLQVACNEGPTADILEASIELFNLPKIDLHDATQVRQRLSDFFSIYAKRGLKPTVAGMGLALGLDRRRLWEINSGAKSDHNVVRLMPAEVRGSIKEAYTIMEALWESYMVAGKINPATGIFLAKNNWGYRDVMDHVVTPNAEEQVRSADDIRRNYLESGDEIDTDFE